jgi:hypothetical protein
VKREGKGEDEDSAQVVRLTTAMTRNAVNTKPVELRNGIDKPAKDHSDDAGVEAAVLRRDRSARTGREGGERTNDEDNPTEAFLVCLAGLQDVDELPKFRREVVEPETRRVGADGSAGWTGKVNAGRERGKEEEKTHLYQSGNSSFCLSNSFSSNSLFILFLSFLVSVAFLLSVLPGPSSSIASPEQGSSTFSSSSRGGTTTNFFSMRWRARCQTRSLASGPYC